jgi:hypothetical protein
MKDRSRELKVRVGKTYVDGAGCMIRIVAKMNNKERPYVGIVNWETAKCRSSRQCEEHIDSYAKDGTRFSNSNAVFNLKREMK